MEELNNKMIVGSFSKWIDEKVVLGDTVNPEAIILFNNLIDSYNYAASQYKNNNDSYNEKLFNLANKLNILKQFCPQICVYKNRLIFFQENTAPTIDNNSIDIPLTTNLFTIDRGEIVHNYSDLENDGISQIVIVSKGPDNVEFLIDDTPVILNSAYSPSINSFKTRYNFDSNKIMLIRNQGQGNSCNPQISVLDKATYDINISQNKLISLSDTQATFKRLSETMETLPNDTLVYIHMDNISLTSADRFEIQNTALQWFNSFKLLNTGFAGDLIINTLRNDAVSNDFATGRGDSGSVGIQNSVLTYHIRGYLSSPITGFSRLAYKQGLPVTITEDEFLDFIDGKSMVHLNFQEESKAVYTPLPCVEGVFNSGTFTQPSASYIKDYSNFINIIEPRLANFKGFLFTVPTVGQSCSDAFLLHAMGAMEATNLNSKQINALMGSDLVNTYGAGNMQTKFYTPLANNPYVGLNKLKEKGWQGNYTKKNSLALEVSEFTDIINSEITDSTTRQVGEVITTTQPLTDLGNQISETLEVKVRDNSFNGPLFSNTASVGLNYIASCELVPSCGNNNGSLLNHGEDYTYSNSDFTLETDVDKVKINSLTIESGELKYKSLVLTNSILPLVIDIEDLVHLRYISDKNQHNSTTVLINYSTAFTGSENFCENGSSTTLTKAANPNQPATISIAPLALEAATPSQVFNNQTLDATISYTGSGGYNTYWVYLGGPGDVVLEDVLQQDLVLNNLKPVNNYYFRLIVATTEDNFITQQDITVAVTLANQAPTVDTGGDQTVTITAPATTTTATTTATESDEEDDIVTRVWSQVSGPNTASITGGDTLTPIFNNLVVGTYIFKIIVTDGGGLTAQDNITIVVTLSNTAPVVTVTDTTITLPSPGATTSATVTATVTDAQGNLDTQIWTQISGPAVATINQNTNTFSDLTEGVYIFRLTATDTEGLIGSDDSTVTILAPANNPPIVDAGTDQTFTGTATTLSGTASDSDGTIANIQWTKIAGPTNTGLTIVSPNSLTTQVTGLSQGVYIFRLTVTDNGGQTAYDNVALDVTTNPLFLTANHMTITENETTATFPITAEDLDGVAFLEIQPPGPTSNTEYPAGASPIFTPMSLNLSAPYNNSETLTSIITNMVPLGRYQLAIKAVGVGNSTTTRATRTIVKNVSNQLITHIAQVSTCSDTTTTGSVQGVSYIGDTINNGTIFYVNLSSGQRINGNNNTYRGVGSSYLAGQPFTTPLTPFIFQVDSQGVVFNKQNCV